MAGDTETGVTLFVIDEKMDHGPIISIHKMSISADDNTPSLLLKASEIASDMIIHDIPEYVAGNIIPKEQNHNLATYTKKFSTEDGFIEFTNLEKAKNEDRETAKILNNKIRALYPEPGCWTLDNGRRLKILDSKLDNAGLLIIKSYQYEGKNPVII